MANRTITIDAASAKLLAKELEQFEKIRSRLLDIIPESFFTKGSRLWWEKSNLEALNDIKKGRYATVKTHKQLDCFLNKLE